MNKKQSQKQIYRTFEIRGFRIMVDEFTYRRIFKDPEIKPKRKYTFIRGINIAESCVRIILKSKPYKTISLARYIMHAGKGGLVDHRNRNPFDNRRCNLRIVNARQNGLNRIIKNNTGYVGVSINNDTNFVSASFVTKGKTRLYFNCKNSPFNRTLAALARDKYILEANEEEYAILNFPKWQFEPLRSILMKEDLSKYKETNSKLKTEKQKLNQKILRFCRKMATRA